MRKFRKTFTLAEIRRYRIFLLLLPITCQISRAEDLQFTPLNKSGVYQRGEKVGWTVTASRDAQGPYTFVIRKNNLDVIKTGDIDFASGDATIETTVDEPAMLFLTVTRSSATTKPTMFARRWIAGAAIGPTQLQPITNSPVDFDEFWQAKIN